jgi:hypothetical protein
VRRFAVLLVSLAGCYQSAAGDDAAPEASSIPTAAHSAIGADYPLSGVTATATSGIPECDAYFQKIENCRGLPPSTRTALVDAAKAMRESIAKATSPEMKDALKQSCQAATEALSVCDTNL